MVFTFTNTEASDSNWEVRVSAESLGGCGESQGYGSDSSGWLEAGDPWARVLNLECSYLFTAIARNDNEQEGKVCDAVLGWGAGTPDESELRTRSTARGAETRVSVQHEDPLDCDSAIVATFSLDPEKIVEALPDTASDPGLQKRAERAVEVTDFKVAVRPEESTKSRRGCNQTFTFDLRGGEDGEVEIPLPGIPDGASCKFRATITESPGPFGVADTDGLVIDTSRATDGDLPVDLSSLLELPYARIAIVQDTTDSGNQGVASYKIDRSCAGVASLPPSIVAGGGSGIYTTAGGKVVANLTEGRFTVHSDRFANFGPGATYLAVARSTTSSTIAGCTVSVTISEVPSSCTVAPAATQTRTWTSNSSFDHFDFEFDIYCGGTTPPPDTGLPPSVGTSDSTGTSTGGTSTVATVGTDDVRIVARKLSTGQIEFGLQQQQDDDSWGDNLLPRARLFPTDARVGVWLQSSPLPLTVAASSESFAEEVVVRIVASKREDGRVEFGLQQRGDAGSWGERQLPRARLFPTTTRVDVWLRSSVLALSTG